MLTFHDGVNRLLTIELIILKSNNFSVVFLKKLVSGKELCCFNRIVGTLIVSYLFLRALFAQNNSYVSVIAKQIIPSYVLVTFFWNF